MILDVLPIFVMVLVAIAMGGLFLYLAKWLGANRKTSMKETTYESGLVPYKSARQRFSIKYYMIAVSFIIFDIEVVFLYPWAVRLRETTPQAFVAMMIFIIVLFIAWLWEYKKGALKWD